MKLEHQPLKLPRQLKSVPFPECVKKCDHAAKQMLYKGREICDKPCPEKVEKWDRRCDKNQAEFIAAACFSGMAGAIGALVVEHLYRWVVR